jgi:hypothetical protein
LQWRTCRWIRMSAVDGELRTRDDEVLPHL